jgi:carbamoyltransferase
MIILGINAGHDAGAAIIKDGKVISAINEERLNRKKMYWGEPYLSINEVIRIAGIKAEEIDYIAIAGITQGGGVSKSFKEVSLMKKMADFISLVPFFRTHLVKNIYKIVFSKLRKEEGINNYLAEKNIKAPIKFIEHHYAHAASAYYCSNFSAQQEKDVMVVTLDSAGDGLCSTISIIENGKIIRKNESIFFNSPSSIYSYVTYNLGFKYLHHEGKITGLAAYGDYTKTIDVFRKIISYDKDKLEFKCKIGSWGRPAAKKLHLLLQGYKREDIAAGVQKMIEEVVSGYINDACIKYGKKIVCLAGGVFANVKLNQVIFELPVVEDVYIHQNMGDGGTAVGSALACYADLNRGFSPICLKHAYLGSEFNNDEIMKVLQSYSNIKYDYYDNIQKKIAELLAEGKIIARFCGAMEYGPRALGHRSILYKVDDKTINDWLNKKLQRTEFMPFAPIILKSEAYRYFKKFEENKSWAANFMTITYNTTTECDNKAPAITHIDHTARPQLVNKEDNTDSFDILTYYYGITDIPILINTSFNMHEEPIVCTPDDAIRAYQKSGLEILAIGNYIVTNK